MSELRDEEREAPTCDCCGKADCPDADLPAFTEPRKCEYASIYHALRDSKDCDYGCARDYTTQAVRLWVVGAVERILADRTAALEREVADLRGVVESLAEVHWRGEADPEPEDVWRYDRDWRAALVAPTPAEEVPCVCGARLVKPYPNDTGEHSTTECPAPAEEVGRDHILNEYGTTDCPVEGVRADSDDGECSACGGRVHALNEELDRDE